MNKDFQILKERVPGVTSFEIWNGSRYLPGFIDTTEGTSLSYPALGGCRFRAYENDNEEALADAARLSRGMHYKSALAKLALSGGKAVIVADPFDSIQGKNETVLKGFAHVVNTLGGRYITAEDSGTTEADMNFLAQHTSYVVGTSGKPFSSGNPSPITAYGVFCGINAGLKYLGLDLEGRVYNVKGAGGSVASFLLFGFPEEDSRFDPFRDSFPGLLSIAERIYCSEIREDNFQRVYEKAAQKRMAPKLVRVGDNEIYQKPHDVFVPAALGGSLSEITLPWLQKAQCKFIGGPENNQQLIKNNEKPDPQSQGILYSPDFAINAGGIINVFEELTASRAGKEYELARALQCTEAIASRLFSIFKEADNQHKPTFVIAEQQAEKIIANRNKAHSI